MSENVEGKQVTSEKVTIDSVVWKRIEVGLNGVKEATSRSRFVFIVMTIAAATILISLWNSTVAWDKQMAFLARSGNPLVAENQRAVTNEWLSRLNISVDLLGIRVGTYDLAVIGSSSLIVIMVWFFFSQRRENRAIVGLLRYCSEGLNEKRLSKEACNLAYEGIVQSIVFIEMGGGDKPIKGLVANEKKGERNKFIRRIITGLVFLPPVTIFLIVIADIYSLTIPSYQRESQEPLWRIMLDGNHDWNVLKIVCFEAFAISACFYTWGLCRKCRAFSKATSQTIKHYRATGFTGKGKMAED